MHSDHSDHSEGFPSGTGHELSSIHSPADILYPGLQIQVAMVIGDSGQIFSKGSLQELTSWQGSAQAL